MDLLGNPGAFQHDPERRALAGRGVELDPPAERPDGIPDDGETEPEALRVALSAVEAVEHVPLGLRRDAGTRVLYLERDRGAAACPRRATCPPAVCFAAFSPRLRSACSSRPRLTCAASLFGHRRRNPRHRRAGPKPVRDVAEQGGEQDGGLDARLLLSRVRTGDRRSA